MRRSPRTIWIFSIFMLGFFLLYFSKLSALKQPHADKHEDLHRKTVKREKACSSDQVSQPRKCKKNIKAANISGFDSLSLEIQDFLYHRHCRHFPLILDLPDKCGGADHPADIFLLLVIKSHPQNFARREVLRKTWATERLQNGVWIKRVFISGTAGTGFEKERLNNVLAMENKDHNDILQWDFNETFFNLTLKQILFLEWMDRHCQHAKFLFNGDDDIFAHTNNMIEYLQSLDDGMKHLFAGEVITNPKPIRNSNSKYFVPKEVYPHNFYPSYCGGGGYLLSGYTGLVIYNASKTIPILPIDDVYMAMCLDAVKLNLTHHSGFKTLHLKIPRDDKVKFDPCYLRDQIVVHKFPLHYIYVTWQEMQSPDMEKCKVTI